VDSDFETFVGSVASPRIHAAGGHLRSTAPVTFSAAVTEVIQSRLFLQDDLSFSARIVPVDQDGCCCQGWWGKFYEN